MHDYPNFYPLFIAPLYTFCHWDQLAKCILWKERELAMYTRCQRHW